MTTLPLRSHNKQSYVALPVSTEAVSKNWLQITGKFNTCHGKFRNHYKLALKHIYIQYVTFMQTLCILQTSIREEKLLLMDEQHLFLL